LWLAADQVVLSRAEDGQAVAVLAVYLLDFRALLRGLLLQLL
jgi:hypothetical protein